VETLDANFSKRLLVEPSTRLRGKRHAPHPHNSKSEAPPDSSLPKRTSVRHLGSARRGSLLAKVASRIVRKSLFATAASKPEIVIQDFRDKLRQRSAHPNRRPRVFRQELEDELMEKNRSITRFTGQRHSQRNPRALQFRQFFAAKDVRRCPSSPPIAAQRWPISSREERASAPGSLAPSIAASFAIFAPTSIVRRLRGNGDTAFARRASGDYATFSRHSRSERPR